MYCAIDFGTSNSAIAVPGTAGQTTLVAIEDGQPTMPTAVFYAAAQPRRAGGYDASVASVTYGRAALAAYVDGIDGRLMRSMKSVLGSSLAEQATDVGGGRALPYLDIVAGYLGHLKAMAEAQAGQPIERVVLGRPVRFVDDDAARDAHAQAALQAAAQRVGFVDIAFQFEPIAAAFAHEHSVEREECVLVADIGGGTSDFSVVRVGPERARRIDRRADILANHGVHVAGTDFDRRIALASVLRPCGYGAHGPGRAGLPGREVPSAVYFDLATWHLINTVYSPQRVAELRRMHSFYADPAQHRRLMTVVDERLGHELVGRAEAAKIGVAEGGSVAIDLGHVERGLEVALTEADALAAIEADLDRIVGAARATVADAGLAPAAIDAVFLTGGSTGLRVLAERIAASFSGARLVRGDRFASVAMGLGLDARRRYG